MATDEPWVDEFPGAEGWYWVDDGEKVYLVYAKLYDDEWLAWEPFTDYSEDVGEIRRWTRHNLRPPLLDETDD